MGGLGEKSFVDTDGETRWFNENEKTIFMPYNVSPTDYGEIVKEYVEKGYVIQLEII